MPALPAFRLNRPVDTTRRSRRGPELGEQPLNARVDLVADAPDLLEALPLRILDRPVLVPLSGVDRAGVAATHRDHGVRGSNRVVRERLRELARDVDPHLA